MATYSVVERQVKKGFALTDAQGAKQQIVTRYQVVGDEGSEHWECHTRAAAQAFADAMNLGDDAELGRLAEIAQHSRVLTDTERKALHHW